MARVHYPCLDCVTKHVTGAATWMVEASPEGGYPLHRKYAIGDLYHAEMEAGGSVPELAAIIRDDLRIPIMDGYHTAIEVNFDPVVMLISLLAGDDSVILYTKANNSKKWDLPARYLDVVAKYQPDLYKAYVTKFGVAVFTAKSLPDKSNGHHNAHEGDPLDLHYASVEAVAG